MKRSLHTVSRWLALLEGQLNLEARRKHHFVQLLKRALDSGEFGPAREVVLVRCPGRYSDFGNHTDYKGCGGPLGGTATEEAIYGVFQPRTDGKVRLLNADPAFEPKQFPISEAQSKAHLSQDWNAWDSWTAEHSLKAGKTSSLYAPESWDKYIRRLLFLLTELPVAEEYRASGSIPGFTALYSSDLSYRGGKSSSSALVVNTALGLDALFEFEKRDLDFWIDLIGLSEWFVMTRGGCSDHARMFYSKQDHFVLVGSFPTRLLGDTSIPSDLVRVVVHCGVDRPRDETSLNEMRIGGAGYVLAVLYIKQYFPEFREELEAKDRFYHLGYLRELTSMGQLKREVSLKFLYGEVLRRLPTLATREEVRHALPDFWRELDILFANHQEPLGGYPIRDIAVFGLAETERTLAFMDACRRGNFEEMLRLVRLSHDGDRITKWSLKDGHHQTSSHRFHLSDERLDQLVGLLEENPGAPQARICYLPGRFERSIPEMDLFADLVAESFADDAAIRLMGAGKGGEMHAIVRRERLDAFLDGVRQKYFKALARPGEPDIAVLPGAPRGAEVLTV